MNRWDVMYLFRPPWDRGIPLPELVALVEKGLKPGRVIDLGCGTGSNAIYLAQHGFDVVGVDISSRAIAKARKKAQAADVEVRFLVGDATELPPELGPFDFALDVGCFHSLDPAAQHRYANSLSRLLVPTGLYLLWTFLWEDKGKARFGPRGLTSSEVQSVFEPYFDVEQVDIKRDGWRPGAFYILKRKTT